MELRARKNPPIRGTESEVAGIISATISMKTVRESRTVMPRGRRRAPGRRRDGKTRAHLANGVAARLIWKDSDKHPVVFYPFPSLSQIYNSISVV